MNLSLDDIRLRAWRLEALLEQSPSPWPSDTIEKAKLLFERCVSDAERLLLLDWVAPRHVVALALFIDDVRAMFSSPAACIIGIRAIETYAVERGLVFESGNKEKSIVLPDGLSDIGRSALQLALTGCLQAGTPTVVTETMSMGVAKNTRLGDAQATLAQIERRGAQISRGTCTAAAGVLWPLAARRLYFSRAHSAVAHLLPFVVGYQHTAFRLNALQGR